MVLALCSMETSALAAKTLGDMGNQVAGQFSGLSNAMKMFAFFAGFVLVIAAVVLFAGMKKPGNQTPAAL
ncbi:MAG: hypothetical protein PHC98_02585, partial [Syntrophotalea acetylenica]|nr:hypothetical protein [Syntrophotalea acetylenica]